MRERTNSKSLKDLSTLLQRELNDSRVANELVPYLQGETSEVGFFPSILVALVPKGFLQGTGVEEYPTPTVEGNLANYGDYWSVEEYELGGQVTALGKLSINPEKTDVIVLDGQHRANAFRYLTGTFDDASDNTIYSVFYDGCSVPETFNSELPVTIVWFESESDPISPLLISRRLFVDVNTNAKPVNDSRNILLDDLDTTAVATTNLYSCFATHGYDVERISLLQTGFDAEEKSSPTTTLFTPSIIRYAFAYFLFGQDSYSSLNVKVQRDVSDKQRNSARVATFDRNITHLLLSDVREGCHVALESLHEYLTESVSPCIERLFNDFCFLSNHYSACKQLNDYVKDEADHRERDVWNKVYCGAEGLYSSFRAQERSGHVAAYLSAINALEVRFATYRTQTFHSCEASDIDKAYRTFSSKAGITGLLMALSKVFETKKWDISVVDEFVGALNKTSPELWVKILTDYKGSVVSGLDPKQWTIMRGIFLRVLQENRPKSYSFYSKDNFKDSPDARILCNEIKNRCSSWKREIDLTDEETPPLPDTERNDWCEEAIKVLNLRLDTCGLNSILSSVEITEFTIEVIDKEIEAIMRNLGE